MRPAKTRTLRHLVPLLLGDLELAHHAPAAGLSVGTTALADWAGRQLCSAPVVDPMTQPSATNVTSAPRIPARCRRSVGSIVLDARRCLHCHGPGPGVVWPRRSRRVMWVAIGTVCGAIGLSFALPIVASWIGVDAEEAGLVGELIALPALLLLLPVLILAVVVDLAGRRAYPGMPIVASWDVHLAGEVHVVSLPEWDPSWPDYAWVDGALIPLVWTPTGESSARAALDGGTFKGTLSAECSASERAIQGLFAVLGGTPSERWRYTLQIKRATVEAVPVADEERRSEAGRVGWRVRGRLPVGGRQRVRERDERRAPAPGQSASAELAPPPHGLGARNVRPTIRSRGRAGRRR
jgi:hypothetical protein